MSETMPQDSIEIVFDEALWSLLESAQNNGLSAEQVETVCKAISGFCNHPNFDKFYDKKLNTTQDKFKTIYARAFNVQRYIEEADQNA